MSNTIAVISPHLDDAVLSVGATIANTVARGTHVHVLTIFSRTLVVSRVHDDERALAILGARAHHLDLLDAPLRGIALTWRTLCGASLVDEGLVHDANAALANVLDRIAPDEVWAPLACGHHIDHRVACLASLPFATALYEDRPYARAAGSVVDAWLALDGASISDRERDEAAPAWIEIEVDACVPFLDAVRAPASENAARAIARVVRARGSSWHREEHRVDDVSRGLRMRAIECYQSERASFLNDAGRSARWPFSDASEILWRRRAP